VRLNSHRHFLGIRLHDGEATVYPIKLEKIPNREEWRENPVRKTDPAAPIFVPSADFKPELIEVPIVIIAHKASSTSEVKNPD
jgi:hypothetical protein